MLSIKACDASLHFHKFTDEWQDVLLGRNKSLVFCMSLDCMKKEVGRNEGSVSVGCRAGGLILDVETDG